MTFEQHVVVDAPAGALFKLSQDYGRRLEWDPFLRSAELLDGAEAAGVGVRALCVAHNGWAMETEYVSFHPPRACAVRMTRGPRLIESFAGSWRFEEIDPGRTRIGFKYHLRAGPRWLSVLATPVVACLFARQMRKRLAALKAFVESRGMEFAATASDQESRRFR